MSAPHPTSLDTLTALAEQRAWSRGELGHLLTRRQRQFVRRWRASPARRFVAVWTRRGGKSRTFCTTALEECLRAPKPRPGKPGYSVKYAAPTQSMALEFVLPIMAELLEGAQAAGVQVKFNAQQLRWTFPANGATIKLAGCDGPNANRLRGPSAHLVIIDECGFVDDLTYVIDSILRPQLTTTDGRMLLSSTPPFSPSHPFTKFAMTAEAEGAIDVCTIMDAEHLTPQQREDAIEDIGGRESTACKREYFCEFVAEESRAIIPEFQKHRAAIVVPWTRPDLMDRYVSADFGFNDLTVVLFAYLDFEHARLVVERELVFKGKGALDVGDEVKRFERELWNGASPMLRVADAPLQVLADLNTAAGIRFNAAAKVDADAALNHLRRRVSREQIVIDPSCTTTIAHMHYGLWNKNKSDYQRGEDGEGHCDGIDAMKYLVRHVDWRKMPDKPLPKRGDDVMILRDRKNDLATQLRRRS